MDSSLPNEISEEIARELLIQISQWVPGEELPSKKLPTYNQSQSNGIDPNNGQKAEEYRSKLISISYTKPFDVVNAPSQFEDVST